jgi:hypothetical protein
MSKTGREMRLMPLADQGALMKAVEIVIGEERFRAELREDLAPRTCARFSAMLPWRQELVHARWSGEACWVPLGSLSLDVGVENPTSRPRPGDILFYPGGISETEILLAYGDVRFACKAGELAGNPLLTVTNDLGRLAELGREILRSGSRPIRFSHAEN